MLKKILLLFGIMICLSGAAPSTTTWVAIGDSITYLNDHVDETDNRITKGYLTLITERFPDIQYINQGHNGWTSARMAEQIESIGLVKADVYTVFLGTNDWWHGVPVGTIEDYRQNTGAGTVNRSFRIIMDKIRTLNGSARIIFITPMQRGDFVYILMNSNNAYGSYREKNDQSLEDFANAILAIGKLEHIPVVDLYHESGIVQENIINFKRLKDPQTGEYRDFKYPDFIGVPFNPQTDEYPYPVEAMNMTYDGLHPSDKGHEVIADLLVAKWEGINRMPGSKQ